MAAGFAASAPETAVTLFEQNPRTGAKLRITGKGRCNITNDTSPAQCMENVVSNPRFLFAAFHRFTPADTILFFEDRGLPLKTERGRRVFPQSDNAGDVVAVLTRHAEMANIDHRKVVDVDKTKEGFVLTLQDRSQRVFNCLLLATGGMSYPKTGSRGDGYGFAQKLGHTVISPKASLVPLYCKEKDCSRMTGLSLKNVTLTVADEKGKKPVYFERGEMLFTHVGISGPLVLSASALLRDKSLPKTVYIDLKPALTPEVINQRILKDFESNLNRDFTNSLSGLLPKAMIPVVVERSGIFPRKKVNTITREERKTVCSLLKAFSLTVTGLGSLEEAIVTAGGIHVKEVNPRTMESRLVPGLYFAGEILDVDALTGGYNLQIAFSTGYLAAKAMTQKKEV
jgi:hypothetical protein